MGQILHPSRISPPQDLPVSRAATCTDYVTSALFSAVLRALLVEVTGKLQVCKKSIICAMRPVTISLLVELSYPNVHS